MSDGGREGPPGHPADDGGEHKARGVDLALGLSKVLRPWLVGLLLVTGVVVVLLIGANRPDDPSFAETTQSTASRFTYEERMVLVGERCLRVQVADTTEKRAQGLKDRDNLGDFQGMLFQFEQTSNASFTMSGVRFPLTIAFYAEDGSGIHATDMEPCPDGQNCPAYSSTAPFRTALEVAKGQLPPGPLVGPCPT